MTTTTTRYEAESVLLEHAAVAVFAHLTAAPRPCFVERRLVELHCAVCGAAAEGDEGPLLFADRAEATEWVTGMLRAWRVVGRHAVCGQCLADRVCAQHGQDWGPWRSWPRKDGTVETSRDCTRCWRAEYQTDRHPSRHLLDEAHDLHPGSAADSGGG